MTSPAPPQVRIYGPSIGYGSWARVAAGMRSGLEQLGALAGFYELEDAVRELDDGMPAGHDAHLGVLIGPPSFANILSGRGEHKARAVMIAANSSWLPAPDLRTVEKVATELIAPSEWSASVVGAHTDVPVSVWRHGVSEVFRPDPTSYAHSLNHVSDSYRVLHLASTSKERKGTVPLVRAWIWAVRRGWLPRTARLDIAISGTHGYVNDAIAGEAPGEKGSPWGIRVVHRLNFDEQHMAALYQQYDLVCQPSRAEGFGLVPLEARACGVPVCATLCTGHAEHMTTAFSGVPVVPHGAYGPIDDGPGAMAPTVDADDIERALRDCYDSRRSLHEVTVAAADVVRHVWSWEAVCQRWLGEHF